MPQQMFENYSSKYLDLRERQKTLAIEEQASSIINEVDFELELIARDEINVAYILALLAEAEEEEQSLDPTLQASGAEKRKAILNMLDTEAKLRSKRELIERFISDYMPIRENGVGVHEAFESFWSKAKEEAITKICVEEGLKPEAFKAMLESYNFSGKEPLRDDIVNALSQKPKILERKSIVERITAKLLDFVGTYDDGIGGL